ncbi:hypothetical protein [Paracraurococcus lichenis]|uniref:DUF4394 domain-containing protein n=1 Tax=Paracraurococcus lichenis TaxID=3064888 RepID=A0ABT9E3C5_9PROT|nr:hypothetical protein [Paracraurococcus sp. LOR1-02]MDO9710643.1 hypothetical protein [Paracraurococcus sp. LOR1-02]
MSDASLQTLAPTTETRPILGGETTVTLTSAATLAALGIQVAPLGSASVDAGAGDPVAFFPITGGTAGDAPGITQILHEGSGLALSTHAGTIELTDFRIDTLFGTIAGDVAVNGYTVPNVALFSLGADGATLTLTPIVAQTVGGVLGAPAVTPDVVIGLADTFPSTGPDVVLLPHESDTQPFVGGETLVTLTSAPVLASLGIEVGLTGSAGLDASGAFPVADFPVTGGTAGLGESLVILHQGSGLTLSNAAGSLDFADFIVDTKDSAIYANVSVYGQLSGNIAVFEIGQDATLTLTPFVADLANQVFGTTAITAEVPIGTAAPMPELFIA